MSITITGVEELQRALAKAEVGPLKKTLQKGTNASAKFLKPKVQAAAPRRTGKLRKNISAAQAKRDRPASIVKVSRKVFYDHFVVGGTKPHRIRFPDQVAAGVPKSQGNIEHPGGKANPFFERVGEQYDREAFAIADKIIREELP
jgi:hypothetical protein